MPLAWSASIIFGNMNNFRPRHCSIDSICQIFLFDICMKCVIHHSDIWMIDFTNKRNSLGDARKEIVFKSIEILNDNRDIGSGGILGNLPHCFGAPLYFIVCWSASRELTKSRVSWSSQQFDTGSMATVDSFFHCINCCGSYAGGWTYWIIFSTPNGDSGSL